MKLEVRHLNLLVAITEEKSVTRAGARLRLTPSALSHQLRDLEEKLGTPLFVRVSKKLVLTQAGERILQSARKILSELKCAEEDVAQMATSRRGILRLSTQCYTCYQWLPGLLREFHQAFPQIEIRIVVEATPQPIPALLDGQIDLAIVHELPSHKRLQSCRLFSDEIVVVMNPTHPLATRRYLTAQDIADQKLILPCELRNSPVYHKLLQPAGITVTQWSQIPLVDAVIEMVSGGLGISVLARWAVADHSRKGTVVVRPLTKKGIQRHWQAVTLNREVPLPYLSDFIERLSRPAMPLIKPDVVR